MIRSLTIVALSLLSAACSENISGDVEAQRAHLLKAIVRYAADERMQQIPGALPIGTTESDLQIVREFVHESGRCKTYTVAFQFDDGRIWYWAVNTDTYGYPVLDAGQASVLPAGSSLNSIPVSTGVVNCWEHI